MNYTHWEPSNRLWEWTEEEWRDAFRAEGPFSWEEWHGAGFIAFKQALSDQGAEFNSYKCSEGKCLQCDARVAVYDLRIEFLHRRAEDDSLSCDRRVALERYRDPCCG